MKVLLGAIVVLVLMIGAQTVYAETAYQSGFKHGVSDAKDCVYRGTCGYYILQPGNGFQFHTWDFIRGYVDGWCSYPPGTEKQGGFESEDMKFDCGDGPTSATWLGSV